MEILKSYCLGQSGIRTHDIVRYNSFQDYRFKPLGHPSDFSQQMKGFEPLTSTLARLHSTN
jgi:hypothetical protein